MKKFITVPLSILFLTGCSLTPDYMRPVVESPDSWSAYEEAPQPSVIAYDWWTSFKSNELDGLMAQALEYNTDLRAGLQRIEQSRAALKITGADLLPSAGGLAGASQSKSNPATGKSTTSTLLNTEISASYELDLFGANRSAIQAAEAGYQGNIYNQEALKLTLMGDVANSYFTLVNLRERLAIADNNLTNAREVLRIIAARVREGAESDLELAQQKSAVASSEASRAFLIEKISNAENALAVLLGQAPQTITIVARGLDGLIVPEIAAEQPSNLLERRPDLLSAEADLIAANANIGAARAAFYPSITLGLSGRLSSTGFGDPASTALGLASSVSVPIFQGERLEGGLEQASARHLELVETYRGNVLRAFQEVEDALAAVKAAQIRETALYTAIEQSRRAYQLSKSRYDAGLIDYQTLLDTQNAQLSAEDSYAQARLERLTASIVLYRVLGGGWSSATITDAPT